MNVSFPQGVDGRTLGVDVIDHLCAMGLAPSPANYAVWFAHRAQNHDKLTQRIDARMAVDAAPPTQEEFDLWYGEFFDGAAAHAHVMTIQQAITRELTGVLDAMRSSGAHNRAFGETLQAAANLEAGDLDRNGFAALVKQVIGATRRVAADNEKLGTRIEEATQQVESLKTVLHNVRAEASTDALTGLANRRQFDRALASEAAAAEHSGAPLSLLVCDIDHFKRVNDQFGHPVGDQVIRYVAGVIARLAPTDAVAARYGGEEFALLLPRLGLPAATVIGEQMLADLRSRRISKRSSGEMIGAVSISIGAAERGQGETASGFLARADQSLYAAKRSGRDRLVAGEPAAAAA